MQIKSVVPRSYEKSIPPGLSFQVDIEHVNFQEAIVSISGWVESDDGKVLANILEVLPDTVKSNELAARGSSLDSRFTNAIHHTTPISPLQREALNYIENRRLGNTKRDIYLTKMWKSHSRTKRTDQNNEKLVMSFEDFTKEPFQL